VLARCPLILFLFLFEIPKNSHQAFLQKAKSLQSVNGNMNTKCNDNIRCHLCVAGNQTFLAKRRSDEIAAGMPGGLHAG